MSNDRVSWWTELVAELGGGREMGWRWWKVMEGMVVETWLMYGVVEPALYGGGVIRIFMEIEGLCVSISFASSTMEIRWPMAGDG